MEMSSNQLLTICIIPTCIGFQSIQKTSMLQTTNALCLYKRADPLDILHTHAQWVFDGSYHTNISWQKIS